VPLSQKQIDATDCARAATKRVGLYVGLKLTREQFRAKPCADLVDACGAKCPLKPANYNTCLITFRESMRQCLKDKGYSSPKLQLGYLCMVWVEDGEETGWTWGDWCDYVAQSL
jgi:hypothetical protein